MATEFRTFEEFWPHYVREHSRATTRRWHFVGTTAALACTLKAVSSGKARWLAIAALAGYGPAWISHFAIERNKPASFRYPAWSLKADLIMWGKMLTGTMQEDVLHCLGAGYAQPVTIEVEATPVAVHRN